MRYKKVAAIKNILRGKPVIYGVAIEGTATITLDHALLPDPPDITFDLALEGAGLHLPNGTP